METGRMAMSDLDEISTRLQWVSTEIDSLEGEVQKYSAISLKQWIAPHETDRDMAVFFAEKVSDLPAGIGIRTGTLINEMRSCLDALACALALRNSRTVNQVYFPICETEHDFKTAKKGLEKMRKLSSADQDTVLSFKPYQTCDDGTDGNPLLWALHKADVMRKHQRLIGTVSYSSLRTVGDGFIGKITYLDPSLNDKPMRVAEISRNTTIGFRFLPIVVFDEPDFLKGKEVILILREFLAMTKDIVAKFA